MRRLLLLLFLFALTGCETINYRLVPPPSDAGRLCVTQCAGIREACIGQQQQQANFQQHQCERREDHEYDACLNRAGNDRDRLRKCARDRDYCGSYAQTERCEVDYRGCFSNCGGMVIQEVEQW
jgi:hypothetical protein